ncbi:MAG: ankyrin repeat domain-containing protein [Myxococcota bacterium]
MTHSRTPRTAIAALRIATSTTTGAAWGMNPLADNEQWKRLLRNTYSIHDAAKNNCAKHVLDLLNHANAVDQRDGNGKTPLYHAIRHGRIGVVRVLLDFDAGVAVVGSDPNKTALHVAARWNRWKAARVLLEHDSQLLARTDGEDRTPLHLACSHGHVKTAEELLAWGANPDRQDAAGDNAWTHAARGPEKTWRKVVAALKAAEERRRDQRAAITQALDEPEWRDILKILHAYADCDER